MLLQFTMLLCMIIDIILSIITVMIVKNFNNALIILIAISYVCMLLGILIYYMIS